MCESKNHALQFHSHSDALRPPWQVGSPCVGKTVLPRKSHRMRQVRRAILVGLSAWLIVAFLVQTADARIKTPRLEELVDSADLVVIGKIATVRATPPALWRQVGAIVLLIATAAVFAFLFWKKKVAIAACLVAACLLVIALFDVPFGTYRRVAEVSVSSTIKGRLLPGNISIYYDDGLVCDDTHFDVQQEYLLFLKRLPSGYTTSWYDWSVWTINAGFAQTERRTWHNAAPIAVPEFVSRIENIRDKTNK